jgi:hypothetical protein
MPRPRNWPQQYRPRRMILLPPSQGTEQGRHSKLPARAARLPLPVQVQPVRRAMHRTRRLPPGRRRRPQVRRRVPHRQLPQPVPRQTRTNRHRRTFSKSRPRPLAMTFWAAGPRLRRCGGPASSCRARCWPCQPLIRSCWSPPGADDVYRAQPRRDWCAVAQLTRWAYDFAAANSCIVRSIARMRRSAVSATTGSCETAIAAS